MLVVPRWIQAVALPLLLAALYLVARAAGHVVLLFTVAAVIALILNPVVSFVQRRVPRGPAIAVVFLSVFGLAGLGGLLLAQPVTDQVTAFRQDVPSIIDDANDSLADLQETLDERGIDIEIKRQGETALETLQDQVLGGTGDIVSVGGDLLRELVTAGFGVVLVFVLSVYMLVYGPRIGDFVRSVLPSDGTPQDDFPAGAQRAVAGYVRGQLLFSLIMGTSAGIALWLYGAAGVFEEGRTYAVAFGIFFGVMELVPFIGPVLGALPPILVAFVGDPLTGVWVGLLFLALQQLEGHVVAPLIFGRTLRINPLLVIFALLLGGELYGIIGALVSLPLAALARHTVVHLRRHLVLEPWPRVPSPE